MDRGKRNIPRHIRRRANVYRIHVDPFIVFFYFDPLYKWNIVHADKELFIYLFVY